MHALMTVLTTYFITILATFATLIAVPPSYPYRTYLFALFIVLLVGYPIAALVWVANRINIATAWRTLITCKKRGIVQIYEDGKRGIILGESRIASSRRICIMQTSGIGLIRGEKQAIIAALEHPNTKIQVLLANPSSDFLKEVELMEGMSRKSNIGPEVISGEALLKGCVNEAQAKFGNKGKIGKIYFGYFNTHFRSSLLICDNSWGWMTLILPPKLALETVSIELGQSSASLLNDCIRHFDEAWNNCSTHEVK